MIGRPPVIPGQILSILDDNDGQISNLFDLVYRSCLLDCSYRGLYKAINRMAEEKQIHVIKRNGTPTIIRKVSNDRS